MNKNRYGVGLNAAIGTEESVKLCNLREAVSFAREHGIGFIVQYQYRYGRPLRRVILGWNIKILSYQDITFDEYCFAECSNLYTVHLPYGIKSIGPQCFANCLKLMTINPFMYLFVETNASN